MCLRVLGFFSSHYHAWFVAICSDHGGGAGRGHIFKNLGKIQKE